MSIIRFNTTTHTLDIAMNGELWKVVTLPKPASSRLPSRGTTMVKGTFNGQLFRAVLEPDGEGSHWFRVNKDMQSRVKSNEGGVAVIEIEPINAWSDPELPADIQDALAADPKAHALWRDITPMARWDWIRWVDSVKLIETRNERPARLCSMLRSGKRRPCCFNRALYTPPKSAEIIA